MNGEMSVEAKLDLNELLSKALEQTQSTTLSPQW